MPPDTRARALAKQSASVALRSFIKTFVLFLLAGVVFATLSAYAVRHHTWLYPTAAAFLALVEAIAAGVLVGVHRALADATLHAVTALGLGRGIVRLLFERMVVPTDRKPPADPAERALLAQALDRLTLANAETLLARAVNAVAGDALNDGWLRRTIQTRLVRAISKLTLARFREEYDRDGHIRLPTVRDALERSIDRFITNRITAALGVWRLVALLTLPAVAATQTWLLRTLAEKYP